MSSSITPSIVCACARRDEYYRNRKLEVFMVMNIVSGTSYAPYFAYLLAPSNETSSILVSRFRKYSVHASSNLNSAEI